MNFFKTGFIIFFCLIAPRVFAFIHTYEALENSYEYQSVKRYVGLEELVFYENRIYLIQENDFLPLKAVYSDVNGLYIKILNKVAKRKEEQVNALVCGNGHDIYHHFYLGGCGGCSHPWCNFRCKCHSPWTP
jgi:hypothetical protein